MCVRGAVQGALHDATSGDHTTEPGEPSALSHKQYEIEGL